MHIITKQRIPKTDFASSSWEIMIKYRTNEQRAFFVVETLEFDVLYKTYDIYLDYYCSQKWSADLVSVIEINKNEISLCFHIFHKSSISNCLYSCFLQYIAFTYEFPLPLVRFLLCGTINLFYWFSSFPHLLLMLINEIY